MNIDNYIQMGILIVAVFAIVFSQWSDRKQRKLQMYAEYTRRYEDLFRNMPDDIYNGAYSGTIGQPTLASRFCSDAMRS